MCPWNRTSGRFPRDLTLGEFSHYDCLVFDDFFVLADRVLFGNLSDSGVCLAVVDSLSFLEVYFGRGLRNGFVFHMRGKWRRTPGIFACVYAHIDHMVLKLGFLRRV